MAMRPGPPRQPVGSTAWCTEERSSALQISRSEVEEFGYSARNELEWLNEHMADIFSENQINVAEVFKTPGKLRGKTPRTARKPVQNENRVPLSNIFSATPQGEPNPFTTSALHNDRTPKFRIAEDHPASPAMRPSVNRKPVPTKSAAHNTIPVADSGYYGSQSQEVFIEVDEMIKNAEPGPQQGSQGTPRRPTQVVTVLADSDAIGDLGSATEVFEDPVEPEKVAETDHAGFASPEATFDREVEAETVPASSPVNLLGPESPEKPPAEVSPSRSSPAQPEPPADVEDDGKYMEATAPEPALELPAEDYENADVTRSPSDGSSPIRPLVRKSSLNFASLPAREPMASNKSLGARMSRTSHVDLARTSYYPRQTGGKSLGIRQETRGDDHEAMDIDEDDVAGAINKESTVVAHSKTYTQRLQDQISMLGKSQAGGPRLSKSIPSLAGTQKPLLSNQSQVSQAARADTEEMGLSPQRQHLAKTPGAFPEDDGDDWIAPPTTIQAAAQSPRPAMEKSYTTDVMEGLHSKNTVGGTEFVLPRHPSQSGASESPPDLPAKKPDQAPSVFGHIKSASIDLPSPNYSPGVSSTGHRKIVSASNPVSVTTQENNTFEPPKSPSRTFRESPLKNSALKQVKNKFSSILKNSRGLLASSAAISAEGKASLVNSPSNVRLGKQPTSSNGSLRSGHETEPLYPDLTRHASWESQPVPTPSSPSRPNGRKTRASTERDKREQKQKDREGKEANHIASQMDKLEKEREKEREKARVFSQEQERIAAEKQLAAQKEHERSMRTPAPKEAIRPTRSSPRKAKTQQESAAKAAAEIVELDSADQDIEMTDAATTKMAPASIPRPTPGQSLKKSEIKRPQRPTKEPATKARQAPTLIRVNTSSQNTGFHPSNSVLAATLENTLGPSQQQMKSKTSQPTLQSKMSQQSFNSSVNSSTGRPKALDLAAKRKQQEEKEAQRRRDAKAEIDRKRAAMREEDRRQEQERREKDRQQAAKEEEAKKKAQRQAAIEKAKQTRAPPPAVRSQPNAPPEHNGVRDKAGLPRPASRLQQSTAHRSQEDVSRPVNAVLSSTASMSLKRPLQQDGSEDGVQRPTAPRNGPSQPKEVKRMRMSDEFDFEDEAEMQSYGTSLKGPPVRPSAGFKKDQPNKSLYSGYATAPQGATRDIFKAPVAPQHSKSGHPLDMAQVSKGPIPFAANHHAAGPSHKTPARPKSVVATKSAAKPANRSSPRFQNGDNIELPEIQTDDDDDEEEEEEGAKALGVASWADTPALRRELMRQETVDPLQVFGPPAPLNMEEVFSKSKDRWHKFRARTSSANWSGADRLTEDEIRKDLAARDRMRREGGWTYELSKDM
ncbi:hypothetical protein N8I77_001151 [Diaporthe amygdali]|uniref:Inner centromere protein ARK-binding domain-containing protein n=1 Tax=Phomopsis amygdali TaxID=1214568 RepID=A0AAD9W7V1_PHOAM|nr:hypothetical protein N8I77_001151 [Diaporthe amygdali]